jgi:multiple sugar transport system permease protein
MDLPATRINSIRNLFTGRRGRNLREYVSGYLMIAPATLLILIFGIFPVGFALYVSLHQWRLIRGELRGLRNYVDAIDNLAYIALFGIGVAALIGAFIYFRRVWREAGDNQEKPWLLAVPAALYAAAALGFVRWLYFQLPEFLDIAAKIRGVERTRELFVSLLKEAFRAESVYPAWQQFTWLLAGAVIAHVGARFVWRSRRSLSYLANLAFSWLALAIGIGLLWVTFTNVNAAYAAAVETGEDPGIWPQLIMVSSGVILLFLSWRLWRSAEKQDTTRSTVFRWIASLMLAVGAVLLIIEIPTIVASGDEDLWQGLKVTVFFSLGTVPVQLTIALFLAVLLFQKMRGSEIFRILFFLPYVTPVVASAAVFREMFSVRFTSPANAFLKFLGIQPQGWLRESEGVLSLIANGLGFSIPEWAAGPSLALVVIITHSVWTFVGYNVVIYLAGLGNIPAELTEAAEIDGASRWEVFRNITFPLLSPTTYFLSLLAIIGTFKAFNTIWILRDGAALGTTDPFSVVIFIEFFQKTRYGYASALAFVLFGIILSLTYVNNRIQGSRVFYG